MIRKLVLTALLFCTGILTLLAQGTLSIDKVYTAYLRNSGTIMENNQIKGYFFLYQSDKIDKNTNEYTLQILDQNLNKVKSIKFEDSKKLSLMEAAYNGGTLAFLFNNVENQTTDMKIYDMEGKLKYTYIRPYDKQTEDLMKQYATYHTDEGTNENVFDLGEKGYVSVLPLRDNKQRTYEVDYYSSQSKKQWAYVPADEERFAMAEFLGNTDSLIILEVMKKSRALSGKVTSQMVGINFVTRKKVFELEDAAEKFTMVPSSIVPIQGTGTMMVIGSYFNKDANIVKDASQGLAIYKMDSKGKILSRTYNSWADDFGKYLPSDSKGKIDKVGFVFIHKIIQTPDGKMFAVGEGYKRQASAGGIALTALGTLAGGRGNAGVTRIVVTDMVMMEFNGDYKVTNATIYDKTNNTVAAGVISDYSSQHMIALYCKGVGAFDYEFTTGDPDNSNFSVCYSDWVRSSEYKGQTFNTIHYNGSKFTTDKIELKSKASSLKIFPAKAGSVMILEYFKKDKRLDLRLEKIN